MILRIFYKGCSRFFRVNYILSDKEGKTDIQIRYLCIIASSKEVIFIYVNKVI